MIWFGVDLIACTFFIFSWIHELWRGQLIWWRSDTQNSSICSTSHFIKATVSNFSHLVYSKKLSHFEPLLAIKWKLTRPFTIYYWKNEAEAKIRKGYWLLVVSRAKKAKARLNGLPSNWFQKSHFLLGLKKSSWLSKTFLLQSRLTRKIYSFCLSYLKGWNWTLSKDKTKEGGVKPFKAQKWSACCLVAALKGAIYAWKCILSN